MTDDDDAAPRIHWIDDDGAEQSAAWRSLASHPAPQRVQMVDDTLSADAAYRLACEGCGLLWIGDFQNARALLQALGRRVDSKAQRGANPRTANLKEAFLAQRRAQAQRARVLGMLLLPFDADHSVPLRRAPDVRAAGLEAHGPVDAHYVASLRELLGLIGAHEWRKNGVPIDALGGARIHPHHGVYSPVRGEYVELVAQQALPAAVASAGAFDIGCGTGVLAAVLARRGLSVIATDIDPRARACAVENLARLKLTHNVKVLEADLFPPGRAGVVVCNPPWVPATPSSRLDAAVYDADSAMLRGFLAGLSAHLAPGGEGWLVLSDLAEHLGLRTREELLGWIAQSGLEVIGRSEIRPHHGKATDKGDPLHRARVAEITSLWRLAPQSQRSS